MSNEIGGSSGNVANERTAYMQRWIGLAPKAPERGANSYDVFISYRSSDRAWAMALYDALKLAGWEPFLDQFELVPGANLQTSLEESLQASSSGVILWSSRTKDSEWCKRERQAMATMAGRNPSFHYVFAKLDSEQLPLFAQADLYEDFGNSPEGPRGVNLLRLMCGMRGVRLNEEAVRLAQEVDIATEQMVIQIRGAIEAGNATRLRQIGVSMDPGMVASSGPVLEAARGLISMGKPEQGLEVLERAEANFPISIVAKQLKGLALRRLRRYQEAIDVMSELKAAGHQDPETAGILAAAWDGRYQETGKVLYLRRSRELYRTAFQADPKSYYSGVNAASKSLFLGECDEACQIARQVLPLVEYARDGRDFWAACTLAEVYLLQRNIQAAAEQYQKVIDNHAERVGDLHGTAAQARRICTALAVAQDQVIKVLAAFELL
jgi:tetratricopeptide (TPR) repeat protein